MAKTTRPGSDKKPALSITITAQDVIHDLALVLAGQAASDALSALEPSNDNDDPDNPPTGGLIIA